MGTDRASDTRSRFSRTGVKRGAVIALLGAAIYVVGYALGATTPRENGANIGAGGLLLVGMVVVAPVLVRAVGEFVQRRS